MKRRELKLVGASQESDQSWVVSETFVSVQGEGKLVGVPSCFIRISGCNLRCSWCDTPYSSWKPEGDKRRFEHLIEEITRTSIRHVVLTGGEPLIAPGIARFTQLLHDVDRHITIETAGTIPPPPDLACDLMSVSPKLSNSTPAENDPRDPEGVWRIRHEERRTNIVAVRDLLDMALDRQLKFVVSTPEDVQEVEQLLRLLASSNPHRPLAPEDILLMPEEITPPTPQTRQWVAKECMARGWRYCARLHIEIYGNKRGT